jgi:hypothetical protein
LDCAAAGHFQGTEPGDEKLEAQANHDTDNAAEQAYAAAMNAGK